MIGELMADNVINHGSENKKRSIDVVAEKQKTTEFLSPPAKKMKQARLPFSPKMSPNSQMTKCPSISPASKQRKVTSEENNSPVMKSIGNKPKKTPTKAPKPSTSSTPKTVTKCSLTLVKLDHEDQVPTSSSECISPGPKEQLPFKLAKSGSLDGFLQTTQQPQVSTSECIIDITLDSDDEDTEGDNDERQSEQSPGKENLESSTSLTVSLDATCSSDENNDSREERTDSCNEDGKQKTPSLSSSTSGVSIKIKESRGKPKSDKLLEKEREKQKLRKEKAKLREEKQLQMKVEKIEKESQRKEVQRKRQLEQDEAKKEKETKRKERQAKRDKEEEEREEKRKQKQEARQKKQEELELLQADKKKKLDEKQRQEDGKKKDEEDYKKKSQKQQMFFKSFFKKPSPDSTATTTIYEDCGPFAAFQLRKDMVIAPIIRTMKPLVEVQEEFDREVIMQSTTFHYLAELSSGSLDIGKSSRTKGSRRSMKDDEENKDSDIEEVISSSSVNLTAKATLLQFHENHRPPYFGTWRKRSLSVTGRTPFAKDKEQLDYEVDSDDEWEDPGESLSDSGTEDEDDNDSAGDESDNDGFFVPHGYLSEDEADGAEDDRETWEKRRAAKAKDWDREMRKKTEALKTYLIGCVWTNANGISEKDAKAMERFKVTPLVSMPILLTGVAKCSPSGKKKHASGHQTPGTKGTQILAVHNKIRPVPKEAMPDLIRLVHGNIAGIKSLCREFKAFWKQKHTEPSSVTEQKACTSPEVVMPVAAGQTAGNALTAGNQQMAKENSDGNSIPASRAFSPLFRSAEDFEISIRQLEKKITKIAVRDKRDGYSKICWYVHDHVLKECNMESAPVPSTWTFITRKPFDPSKPRTSAQVVTAASSPSFQLGGKGLTQSNATPSKGGLLAMLSQSTSPQVIFTVPQGQTGPIQLSSATSSQVMLHVPQGLIEPMQVSAATSPQVMLHVSQGQIEPMQVSAATSPQVMLHVPQGQIEPMQVSAATSSQVMLHLPQGQTGPMQLAAPTSPQVMLPITQGQTGPMQVSSATSPQVKFPIPRGQSGPMQLPSATSPQVKFPVPRGQSGPMQLLSATSPQVKFPVPRGQSGPMRLTSATSPQVKFSVPRGQTGSMQLASATLRSIAAISSSASSSGHTSHLTPRSSPTVRIVPPKPRQVSLQKPRKMVVKKTLHQPRKLHKLGSGSLLKSPFSIARCALPKTILKPHKRMVTVVMDPTVEKQETRPCIAATDIVMNSSSVTNNSDDIIIID